MSSALAKTFWNTIGFIIKNAREVLAVWAAAWTYLLYSMSKKQGWTSAVQFAMTGLFNLTSVFGMGIALFLLTIMSLKSLSKYIERSITKFFVGLYKKILRGGKGGKKKKLGDHLSLSELEDDLPMLGSRGECAARRGEWTCVDTTLPSGRRGRRCYCN